MILCYLQRLLNFVSIDKFMKEVSSREKSLPFSVINKLLKISSESKEVISLSIGEPDFETAKPILKEAKKIISNYKFNRVNHYTSIKGLPELREEIVKKLKKKNNIKVNSEEILVSGGSQTALFLAYTSVLDPKDEAIIPCPGYMEYNPAVKLVNGIPVPLKLREENGFELDPDLLKKKINRKTRFLMLNTPSNPTGTVISKKILEEVADIAVEKDIYVFSDEAYEDIIYDGHKHVSFGSLNGMKDYTLSFYTFSKSYAMCGYRLGYAAGSKELIEAMTRAATPITLCAPHISQLMGLKALKIQKKYINNMVKEYDKRRKLIVNRLNGMGLKTISPGGSFYAFANIKEYSKDSLKFSEKILKQAKVATVPGVEFGKYGEGYIRFSFASDYKKIELAMNRLEKFLKR